MTGEALDTQPDEVLVRISGTSVEAEGVLLTRYLHVIENYAKQLAGGYDTDDLVQEGLIALLRAAARYDAAQGASFSTFARICILNQMRSFLRREQRAASPAEDLVRTMEEQGDLVDPDTPESILLEKEEYDRCRMQVMAMLSDREWEILQCIMEGASYAQTAQRLQISQKSVDNAMQRIRRKMRAVRSTDYFG